jgi:hypothetical protein
MGSPSSSAASSSSCSLSPSAVTTRWSPPEWSTISGRAGESAWARRPILNLVNTVKGAPPTEGDLDSVTTARAKLAAPTRPRRPARPRRAHLGAQPLDGRAELPADRANENFRACRRAGRHREPNATERSAQTTRSRTTTPASSGSQQHACRHKRLRRLRVLQADEGPSTPVRQVRLREPAPPPSAHAVARATCTPRRARAPSRVTPRRRRPAR